jgi:hypothetical protein
MGCNIKIPICFAVAPAVERTLGKRELMGKKIIDTLDFPLIFNCFRARHFNDLAYTLGELLANIRFFYSLN